VETLALEAIITRKQLAAEAARIEGQTNNLKNLENAENEATIQVKAAEAQLKATKLQAEGNAKLHTKDYKDIKRIEALGNLNKVFYGPDVSSVFMPLQKD